MKKSMLVMVSLMLIAMTVQAAEFGDPAAPLHVAKWIKGGPVDLAAGKGKTVFVVEFWATWCPPCRESILHLSKLQAKYREKGVVVVGISDEEANEVKPFVDKMGTKMAYAVGVDDNGLTFKSYMSAYHEEGIPTAFVIDKAGAVVWAGFPMDGLGKVIDQVLAGSFVPQSMQEVADTEAAEEENGSALQYDYFAAASLRSGQAEAIEIGEKVLSQEGDDPCKLNDFAWTILTDDAVYYRDYPLALRAARQALEKSGGREFDILDTLARALFVTGKTTDAIASQQRAIDLCDDSFARLKLKETLELYQNPISLDGIDDTKRYGQFVEGAVALIKAKRAVRLEQLLSNTDVKPCQVKLVKASTEPISSEKLYEQARQSVLIVGTLTEYEEGGEWDTFVATGFVIHEAGIFVTNFHVLDSPDGSILAAMTADGHVYPVKRVLAVAPSADIAICQLDGAVGLKPLTIAPNAKPGSHVRVLSHPDTAFYSMTEGILSRYFVHREYGNATTMFTTTADFAGGASGGPLFDDCGNVIGMVASTLSVYSGSEDGSYEEPGDLQMVFKMCVPSSDILNLVNGEPAGAALHK